MRSEEEIRDMLNRYKLQQQVLGHDGLRQIVIVTLEEVLNDEKTSKKGV